MDPDRGSISWMAIAKDGTVTVFTGKVELGTGVGTALAQVVAEELDVRFDKVYQWIPATRIRRDQGVTAAAEPSSGAACNIRQASAVARQDCSAGLCEARFAGGQLTVTDGVVSVGGNPSRKIAYGDLLGGKRFNVKITASGAAGT